MTVYEQIVNYSIEEMAEFIYGLITSTEQQLLESVTRQGYNASIVSRMPEHRIHSILEDLQQKVTDDSDDECWCEGYYEDEEVDYNGYT